MVVIENGSSDWDAPLSSLLLPSAARKRRRVCPQGNPPPPPPNLFGKLVDDLLVDILIRLPDPRASCRCKAVCKRWRSLLSGPSFNRRFVSHHQSRYQPASLFLHSHDPQLILSFLPVPDEARPELRVFDCFKDLLLCGFVKYNSELGRSFLVCNPFTKQWIALPLAPEIPDWKPNYLLSAAGLVCRPRRSSSSSKYNYNLVQQLGDGDEAEAEAEPAFVYSEYRFRVVCLFLCWPRQLVQVFCSQSGKWKQLVHHSSLKRPRFNAISWDGKLFWLHADTPSRGAKLAAYNPFRLYIPPESMDIPSALWRPLREGCGWTISFSQGAFHIIIFRFQGSRKSLSVWRREEDGEYWTQLYEMELKLASSSLWGDYKLDDCLVLDLHPEKPEIVFFEYWGRPGCIFSCNLTTETGEPEYFCKLFSCFSEPCWRALQPRVSCWPTPIPRYEELRGMYDGSYDCWVQSSSSNTTTTTLPSTIEEYQPAVEQSGRTRKGKKSAAALYSMPYGRRKQKVVVI